MNNFKRVLEMLKEEISIKEMAKRLKGDGVWLVSVESFGIKHKHSKWMVYWNDGESEQIETDGTDGGSTKSWQEKLAREKATEMRYVKEYKK